MEFSISFKQEGPLSANNVNKISKMSNQLLFVFFINNNIEIYVHIYMLCMYKNLLEVFIHNCQQ